MRISWLVLPLSLPCCSRLWVCAVSPHRLASSYRVKGTLWPGGVVPYFNAAPDQEWAVQRALAAWNTSGARVRFVPVSRQQAKLTIVYSGAASCERAEATIGYGPRRTVRIWSARKAPSATCLPQMAATALAHEFGHVLGLQHESRACAAMNPTFSQFGPGECEPVKRWEWRCRLLEHDDVAGAVAVYGGTTRAGGAAACLLYGAIAPPTLESGTWTPARQLLLELRRPVSPTIPWYLLDRYSSDEAFAYTWSRDTCATQIDLRSTPRHRWPADTGSAADVTVTPPAAPGRYCLSVWAVDSFVRPSEKPLTVAVTVP